MVRDPEIRLGMIVAAAENGVIGRDNDLPWHLPEDLAYFKRVTMGKPIIMGRNTYESIGRPLPGRTNIVISRDTGFAAQGVRVVNSLTNALEVAKSAASADGVDEAVVIGGAQIYTSALPQMDRIYLTRIHAEVPGDIFLPAIDWALWRESTCERHAAKGSNPYDYSFIVYDKSE